MNTVRAYASPDAQLSYGTTNDESLNEQIRITVVVTELNFGA